MKRTVSFLLLILILITFAAPSLQIYALDAAQDFSGAVSYTCTLDEDTGKIFVAGTVNHDVMIKYPEYVIQLYAVAPGERVEDVINDPQRSPLSETAMTIKFTFSISAKSSSERYSKYAIIFQSESGEQYVAGTPKYPAVSSNFEYMHGDRSIYKSVLCESSALSSQLGAGMVVVDVDLEKMLGDNSDAILYPVNDKYISFSKSYVEQLDKKIITASVSGAEIYLRFLLGASNPEFCIATVDDESKRGFPNIYDEYMLGYISSLSKFLMDRYNDGKGEIDGVIIGDRADDIQATNYVGEMSIDQYTDAYVLYITVIASAMRTTDSSLDVVIPISDKDEYTPAGVRDAAEYSFLDHVISELEYGTSGRFKCSVMIQSDVVPFGITNTNIADGIDTDISFGDDRIHADNIRYFVDHIRKLANTQVSSPTNVMFMWEPPADLIGTALNTAYAYIYYKLYSEPDISSFVINASSLEQLSELSDIITYIDTQHGENKTKPLLKYFSAKTWQDVTGNNFSITGNKTYFDSHALTNAVAENYKSSFVYYTFSDYDIFSNTYLGENVRSIYSTYDSLGNRSIELRMQPLEVGEMAEFTYSLDYVESFRYTPVIALAFNLNDGTAESSALYELRLTIGEDRARVVCDAVIESGDIQTLFFDISEFARRYNVDYVKIGVRALTESSGESTLRIYDLRGYSTVYSNEELSDLIEEQRAASRNTQTADESDTYRIVITVICIIFALVAVAAGLFIAFRNQDNKREKRE